MRRMMIGVEISIHINSGTIAGKAYSISEKVVFVASNIIVNQK